MEDGSAMAAGVRPLGLLFLLVVCVMTFKVPRRFAAMPLLITTAYMPLGQQFDLGGIHLHFFRVLLLCGIARVMMQQEGADLVISPLDKLFIWWGVVGVVCGTLADLTTERFFNRLGEAFNAYSAYFLFRCWIRSLEDVIQAVKFLCIMVVPIAVLMIIEKSTMHNVFSVFGGVPEITQIREGKLRCQGAFRHPILAGTYAATLFPLAAGLFFQPRIKKWIPIAGMIGAVVMTVCSSSSGALLAVGGEIIGLACWMIRCRMRMVRWAMLLAVIGLAVSMKAPVWYLFARVSETMGGTGWHRSYLMDQAYSHFNEWWLVGSAVTAHWAPAGQVMASDPRNMDITNNYIAEGLSGGLLKLGLFIGMMVVSFKAVGWWTKEPDARLFSRRMFVWTMGVCMVGHCVSFMSISYFDQIVEMWYWLLASMSMLCLLRMRSWDLMPAEAVAEVGAGVPLGSGQN